MDLVRAIFEKVIEEAARKAAAVATKPTGSASKFQHWKQLLINLGVLTDDEGEVLRSSRTTSPTQECISLGAHRSK
jgi:hypothetical protein